VLYTQEDLIKLGFTNYNKSCVLFNEEGKIEVVFIKAKDLNISKEKLAQFYSGISYLQLTDIQPIKRKSVMLEKAAKTMYMFGCSKQWQAEYASTSRSSKLQNLQPVIDEIARIYNSIYERIIKYHSIFPETTKTGCQNCKTHILNLHNFIRGTFTYNYFAPAHTDDDHSYTTFLTL